MREQEPKPYIELFHESEWALEGGRNSGPEGSRLAEAIERRIEDGHEIHFNPGGQFDDSTLVPVSKDTPIIIGGSEWSLCVQERARHLREQGYKDVRTDHSLSYDIFRQR